MKGISRLLFRTEFIAGTVRIFNVFRAGPLFTRKCLRDFFGVVGPNITKALAWPANGLAMKIFKTSSLKFKTHHGYLLRQMSGNFTVAADAEQKILEAIASEVFEIGPVTNSRVPKPVEVPGDQPVAESLSARASLFAGGSARENEQGIGICGGFFDSTPDVSDIAFWLSTLEVGQIPAGVFCDALQVMRNGMTGNDADVAHFWLEGLGNAESVWVRTSLDSAVGQQADQGGSGTGGKARTEFDAMPTVL